MKPQRIQLSRKKGFNLQKTSMELNGLPAVKCARPSKWGNPFKVGSIVSNPAMLERDHILTLNDSVNIFREWVSQKHDEIKSNLAGKNLACFCPLNQPCHCDVLLEIANT